MTGSLQIKNDKYYAVLNLKTENGKRKSKWISMGLPVKGNSRKAQQRLREILDEYEKAEKSFSKEVQFTDFMKRWLETRKNKVDEVTWEGYEDAVNNHLIPYFEPMNLALSQVTVDHIEEYYQLKSVSGRRDGRPGGLSKRTVKFHSSLFRMIFKEGIRKRLITADPCSVAEMPVRSDKSFRGTFLTESQCVTLLEYSKGKPVYDLIQVTLIYGLRRSELMGLKWDAVNFEQGTLSIRRTVVLKKGIHEKEKTKTNSSNRIYPLVPSVKEILLKAKEQQECYKRIFGNCYQDSGYVFTHPDGSPFHPSYPSHELKKILAKHPDLPNIRFHDLRHTCASLLFGLGWSMKDVSEWLGHSSVAITMDTYTHIDAHRKAMLAKGIDGLFCSKSTPNEAN